MSALDPRDALPRIRALLAEEKPCRLVVTGMSMWPFLRHKKDAVILTPLSRDPRPGDILFYERQQNLCILHRVVHRDDTGLLALCGDNQTALELVRPEQVIALVSHVERNGRLIPCRARRLRIPVGLWLWLLPVRRPLLTLGRRLAGLKTRAGAKIARSRHRTP